MSLYEQRGVILWEHCLLLCQNSRTPYGMFTCSFLSTFFSFKFWANIQLILVQLELIHICKYKLDIAKVYLLFHCSSTLSGLFWRVMGSNEVSMYFCLLKGWSPGDLITIFISVWWSFQCIGYSIIWIQ